jgi:hypothetical protein
VNKFVAVYNWSKSQYEKERSLSLNCEEKGKIHSFLLNSYALVVKIFEIADKTT